MNGCHVARFMGKEKLEHRVISENYLLDRRFQHSAKFRINNVRKPQDLYKSKHYSFVFRGENFGQCPHAETNSSCMLAEHLSNWQELSL